MKITIDEDICKRNNLDISAVLAILLVKTSENVPKLFEELKRKEIFVEDEQKNLLITQRWDDVCANILLSSDSSVPPEERVEKLASELMKIFPEGRKAGTNIYWRGNIKDTKLKLKKFFKLYGNKYSDKEILDAARKYVTSFNGDYSYMRVLKYFIWKDVRKLDSEGIGYVEEVSDLATLIENKDDTISNNEWTAELR